MSETSPMPGRAYSPEQVYENRWLGDITPSAMRKAVSNGDWPCTRLRKKIHFTAENIAEILAIGQQNAKNRQATAATPPRRGRRTPSDISLLPGGEPLLKADPGRARRSRRRTA